MPPTELSAAFEAALANVERALIARSAAVERALAEGLPMDLAALNAAVEAAQARLTVIVQAYAAVTLDELHRRTATPTATEAQRDAA